MNLQIIRFGVIAWVALILPFFFERKVDVGYVMMFVVIYYFSSSIAGFIMKKDFHAGYAGFLQATDENKFLRLLSFLLSVGVTIFIIVLLYFRYFLNFWP